MNYELEKPSWDILAEFSHLCHARYNIYNHTIDAIFVVRRFLVHFVNS